MELLKILINAVSYTYRKDGMTPSVIFSTLKDGSVYCSVVRYGSNNKKRVICNHTEHSGDVEKALLKISKLFLEKSKAEQNPVDILRDKVSSETISSNSSNAAVVVTTNALDFDEELNDFSIYSYLDEF